MLPLKSDFAAYGIVKIGAAFIALALFSVCYAQQSIDQGVADIASRIGKVLVGKAKPKLAVSDFSDLEGRPTEFGRFLAEQLSVEFVNTQGISVVDRANLKSILAEHKLSEDGLINPDTAKKLGQFAGVDVIIIGTVTPVDDGFAVTAKALATDTAEIVAAAKTNITKTKDTQQLANRSINASSTTRQSEAATGVAPVKELGDLQLTTESLKRVTTQAGRGFQYEAYYCQFELTNRNVRYPLFVALNAHYRGLSDFFRAHCQIQSGAVLVVQDVSGLPYVWVSRREDSESVVRIVARGQHVNNRDETVSSIPGWSGSFLVIPAGETVPMGITFARSDLRPPEMTTEAQIYLELIVGLAENRPSAEVPTSARLFHVNLENIQVSH